MSTRKATGCFRRHDDVEESVDQIRFAVGTESEGLFSTEWVATRAYGRSRDFFLATKGLSNDIKVTFHERDVIVGMLAERVPDLRQRCLLKEGETRHRSSVPVQWNGTWIAVHIDFIAGALRAPDRGLPIREGKPITLIAPPPRGHLTRVLVAHSRGFVPQVGFESGVLQWFARMENADRHIAFFKVNCPIDVAAEEQKLRALVEQIPASPEALDVADRGDLAAVMWGSDADHLNFIELHNIARATPVI